MSLDRAIKVTKREIRDMSNNTIALTKVKNDINGNPRYVVHFLSLLSEEELREEDRKHLTDNPQLGYNSYTR
jgi:ferredoxin-fold anticodon binding domain-containing protein